MPRHSLGNRPKITVIYFCLALLSALVGWYWDGFKEILSVDPLLQSRPQPITSIPGRREARVDPVKPPPPPAPPPRRIHTADEIARAASYGWTLTPDTFFAETPKAATFLGPPL